MMEPTAVEVRSKGDAADLLRAVGCVGFVVAAVVLEVVGGYGANSPEPAWARVVFPIGWPQLARVAWWLAVALAAFGYRTYFGRAGFRGSRVVTALLVAPFVIFAAGVGHGASWATWHGAERRRPRGQPLTARSVQGAEAEEARGEHGYA